MALERILLAVGPGNEEYRKNLTDFVTDVASPADITVVLTHVFTQDEFESTTERLGIESPTEVTPDEVARRHDTIRSISKGLDEAGIEYETRGAVGSHSEEIIRIATENNSDLIVVGGRKRTPAGKAVFGSTAQEVMLSAPCPVTLVRES